MYFFSEMKLRNIIILFVLALILSFCQKVYAQPLNPLISFSVESCTLNEALEKLFAEYKLNLVFSKAELSKIRIESYSCSYKSVEEVLSDLLKGTDYSFKKVGKQYVVRRAQQFVPISPDVQEPIAQDPVTVPLEEKILVKTDTIFASAADTIRIIDTVRIIRTVMRYDTVVQVETYHDTVYTVKYKGVAFPWPSFLDNGWFVSPALTVSSMALKYDSLDFEVAPISAFCVGVDGGYKFNRLSLGMSLSYKSLKHNFSFDRSLSEGDCYINDTLDTYYVVHPSGDTTFQYILDSTYIPLTTTNFAYRDINQFDYLSVGVYAAFDAVKLNYFRVFVKAGFSADILISCSGSHILNEAPYHEALTKQHVEKLRWSYFGGLGMGLKVGNHFELVPEVRYRQMVGSLYHPDMLMDLRPHWWDFRVGLTYYF